MLVAENENMKLERERVVNECYPPLKLSGLSVQELQVTNTANHANSAIIISTQINLTRFLFLYRTSAKTCLVKWMLWMKHAMIWSLKWPEMRSR